MTGRRWHRFDSPAVATAFLFCTTAALTTLPFEVLIVLDTFFNVAALGLVAAAFIRLKYVLTRRARIGICTCRTAAELG